MKYLALISGTIWLFGLAAIAGATVFYFSEANQPDSFGQQKLDYDAMISLATTAGVVVLIAFLVQLAVSCSEYLDKSEGTKK